MDDQASDGLRPKLRPFRKNLRCHPGGKGSRCASIAGRREWAVFRPSMGCQQGQVVNVIALTRHGVDTEVATLEDNVRLQWPIMVPAHGCAATRHEVAGWRERFPIPVIGINDGDVLGEGADR
jgi:hypothetical protein